MMLKFDEASLLLEQENGAALIPEIERIVDEICLKGYENLFYIGIGGTVLYANQILPGGKSAFWKRICCHYRVRIGRYEGSGSGC